MIESTQTPNEFIDPKISDEEEKQMDTSLRPGFLEEYVGQEPVKTSLKVILTAAKQRQESMEHVLLYGPPGLGKTTLAHIIAKELETNLKVTSGPAIERPGDLAALLTNLNPGDVLFIDEIHRLNRSIEEVLYSAMEDFVLDIVLGKGPGARSLRMELPKFTLVGATTRAGMISSPLRDRFGVTYRLEYYTPEELKKIIQRNSLLLGAELDNQASQEISLRSRFTPRIANRLLKRTRDFAQVYGHAKINLEIAQSALKMMEIDSLGLDKNDRRILEVLIEKFSGGPVGLNTLAAATGEEIDTISDVNEPFLIRLGLLQKTPKGRLATEAAYSHLGQIKGKVKQKTIF